LQALVVSCNCVSAIVTRVVCSPRWSKENGYLELGLNWWRIHSNEWNSNL